MVVTPKVDTFIFRFAQFIWYIFMKIIAVLVEEMPMRSSKENPIVDPALRQESK